MRWDHTSLTAHRYSFPSDAWVPAVAAAPTGGLFDGWKEVQQGAAGPVLRPLGSGAARAALGDVGIGEQVPSEFTPKAKGSRKPHDTRPGG